MTNSRVFKTKGNKITQKYKAGKHNGIDLVGTGSTLDYIVAHSDGTVVAVRKDCNATYKTGSSYGNYVKIKHTNGYYTLYAHLKYGSVTVKVGDKVKKGQVIGYIGNTGHSFGAHLHFEVRATKDVKIDPTPYINGDLPEVKKDINNDRVKSWQVVMNKVYKCGLDVDSNFGPDCEKKANKYQLYKKSLVILRFRNDYVKWLQNRLKELGYNITVDGSFWNDTDKVVRQFQRDRGLKVDGYVGANTVKELLK